MYSSSLNFFHGVMLFIEFDPVLKSVESLLIVFELRQ